MEVILFLGLQVYLSVVLLISGIAKLDCVSCFENTLRYQKILPNAFIKIVAPALPIVEVLLATSLVLGISPILAASLAALLFTTFWVFEFALYSKRSTSSCGCYGDVHIQSIDSSSVIASAILALLAYIHLAVVINNWITINLTFRLVVTGVFTIGVAFFFYKMQRRRQNEKRLIRLAGQMTQEGHTHINKLASIIFIFFVLFIAGCTQKQTQETFSKVALPTSPNESPSPIQAQKIDCVFADGGVIQGRVLFNNREVKEGSTVTVIFDGGASESVSVIDGHYTAQLIVRSCGSEKTWIGFQLVSSEWRKYLVPQSSPLHVDINLTTAPTANPNEPEVRLVFGTVAGHVNNQNTKAVDGTLVEIKIGGGITQSVYTKDGAYRATTLGMERNGESGVFLPTTISTLGRSETLTPTHLTIIHDFK